MTNRFVARATRLGPFRPGWLVVPAVFSALAGWLVWEGEILGFLLQVLAFLFAGILVARRPRPRQMVRVWVDPAGDLYVGSERFASAGEITSMLVSAHGERALLSIERKGGERSDLEFGAADTVAELRSTLVTGGAQMASQTFRGHVPFGVAGSLAIIGGAVWVAARLALSYLERHPVLVSYLVPLLYTGAPLSVAFARMYSVVIGAEGIWLRRTLTGRGKLVRHRDLQVREGRVSHMLNLYDGEEKLVSLELGNANEARSLAASLRHRRELETSGGGEALEARLARGERSADVWLEDLRKQSDPRAASYRVAKVAPDQLWAVLENPDAECSARIGAAVTLRLQTDDASVRERLRSAASATALPEVRGAAEILAEDENADQEIALARLARTLG